MSSTLIIAQPTEIPDTFGSGGANMAPEGGNGTPTLRDMLRELQTATLALDTALGGVDTANLASTAHGEGASLIGIEDAGALYTATTVEGALAEVRTVANAAMSVQKASVAIDFTTDLAGLGTATTFDKNIGAALPANARVLGATAESETDFDDATHGTWAVTVGTSAGGTQIGTSLNVAAGQTGFPKAFTPGAEGYLFAPNGGNQLSARITSSVHLSTATQGHVVIDVFYLILA